MKTNYTRTDLACECVTTGVVKSEKSGVRVTSLTVPEEEAESVGRAAGRYITIEFGRFRLWETERAEALIEAVSGEIREMAVELTGAPIRPQTKILLCGLGNRFITPDALGPLTADKITVTFHVADGDSLFRRLGCSRVAAVHPGVLGQTGVEAAELLRAAAAAVKPDLVLAVDALAARSCRRLVSTVQLTDSGIEPASGIGGKRIAVSRETLGVPVIALGIPTVVDSSTLVWDALTEGGIKSVSPSLRSVLDNGRSFFVSPKDSDVLIEELSTVLAAAVDRAFGTDLSE